MAIHQFQYIAWQIAAIPAATLAGSSLQRLAFISLEYLRRSGIRLRERQSFSAFLRKRWDPVEASRSTMDPREWFSNQCTMVSLSKSFCTLLWFGSYANLFLLVGNVASFGNSGMYGNLLFYLAKNPTMNCVLPFLTVNSRNKLFSARNV